jgi:hypothetical protein
MHVALGARSASGTSYRLTEGRFGIDGPDGAQQVEGAVGAEVLSVELTSGTHRVELLPGWSLERRDEARDAWNDVDAVLESENPQDVEIIEDEATRLAFRFSVAGEEVTLGPGTLEVAIEVSESHGTFDGVPWTRCTAREGEVLPPEVESDDECAVEPGPRSAGITLRGTVLGDGHIYVDGEVRIGDDGRIACVGCGCHDAVATRVTCPDAVLSPGLIDASRRRKYAGSELRSPLPDGWYTHRHQWRRGFDGYAELPVGAATKSVQAADEVRSMANGSTASTGSYPGTPGLVREFTDLGERGGELSDGPRVRRQAFPYRDASGGPLGSCEDARRTLPTPEALDRVAATVLNLGEGTDERALFELQCFADAGLLWDSVLIENGLVAGAELLREAADSGASLVWQPRNSLLLYGTPGPIPQFAREGGRIVLGSQWDVAGSSSVRDELRCASTFDDARFDDAFTEADLLRMATADAAAALGFGSELGRLREGYVGDVLVVRGDRGNPFAAVTRGEPDDVFAVFRGGRFIFGLDELEGLPAPLPDSSCFTRAECGRTWSLCDVPVHVDGTEFLSGLEALGGFFLGCGELPSCGPSLAGLDVTPDDIDGDGVPDDADLCPAVFDPPFLAYGGVQPDADGDGIGDACDDSPI